MISNRFLLQSTILLLAIGFVVLLGIVATTYWLGHRAQVNFDEIVQARDARGAAAELRNALQTAEASQRGFLFSGNEIYLSPYDTAHAQARRQLDAVKRALALFPEMRPAADRVAVLVDQKFAEMGETIALKRQGNDAEVRSIFSTNRGKAIADETNALLNGFILDADSRLTAGVAEQRENAAWLRWVTILGGVAIVIVVGFAAAAVLVHTRELAAANRKVGVLNAELEERVKERTADLARANEEIQRFAYIVTHDLRAPLVNIMGFTSELEASVQSLQAVIDQAGAGADEGDPVVAEARLAANEDLPEAIGFIRSSTRKMDGLINAILKLSREGRRSLRPEPINLKDMIDASLAAIAHQVLDADGTVEVKADVPLIISDRLALEQVLGNLFDNAVKYHAKDRLMRIEVRAGQAPHHRIAIEIADNGRGIAEQDLERIFEPFRRSGAQDQPGEGIGLAYVRTLVRRLGGEISVSSALDRGTTFRIVLPQILLATESAAA